MTSSATPTGVRDEHVLVPLAHTEPARLSFDSGLERLDLRAGYELEALLDARFGDPLPVVWIAEHNVHVEYPLGVRMLRRMGANSMRANPAVPWSLDVHGAAAHLDADLTGLRMRSLSFHAAVAHTELRLGRPDGECVIRLNAVKDLRIERPADVAVRLRITKGATDVVLDDRRFGAVGGGLVDETGDFAAAPHRYLVTVTGGVDRLTVTSAAPAY